ncbi:Mu transposase domain-containing protein [Stenotrophomonas sp. LARHCG68]
MQRWVLARLRNRVFFSLDELNLAIARLVEHLNDRPMRGCGGKSRQQLFEELDAPALYEYAEWKLKVPVGQDYHVAWEGHFYSVPHRLVGSKISLKATRDGVLAFHRDKRVTLHVRKQEVSGCSMLPEHQPPAHRAYSQDTMEHLMEWAKQQADALFVIAVEELPHTATGKLLKTATRQIILDEYARRMLEGDRSAQRRCVRSSKTG